MFFDFKSLTADVVVVQTVLHALPGQEALLTLKIGFKSLVSS
jgi:hypothetical protein